MVRIYNYSLLQAVPDPVRGERVNVGLVVFNKHGLDIEVFESRKLMALTGHSWDAHIHDFSDVLAAIDDPSLTDKDRLENLRVVEGRLLLSRSGWFEASTQEEYVVAVKGLAKSLVQRPRHRRAREESSVVSEISAVLRSAQILAKGGEALGTGKVLRGFAIEPGLEADFAQLNGALHVASVLDLRSSQPRIAQAALKAVVLDRAGEINDGPVHKIGVIAVAPSRLPEVREHVAILRRYSDDLVNWEDPSDQKELKRIFFDAYNSHQDEMSH
jgi:hypothetical protein